MNEVSAKILQEIKKANTVFISAHTSPDGDAVGSICALSIALRLEGKIVYPILEEFTEKFLVIPGSDLIITKDYPDIEADLFISLDCGDKFRLGSCLSLFEKAKVKINIDHHKSNTMFGEINHVDAKASATSEMIYDLLALSNFTINRDIASAIYAGILYDTGGFRHPNTTPHTYYIGSKLLTYGIPFNHFFKRFFYTKKLSEAKLLSKAISNMNNEENGSIVWTTISMSEINEAGGKSRDLDGVAEYIKNIEDADLAAFFYAKDENEIKISLRCNKEYDVSSIALKFGGGGHKNAAGASFASMEEALNKILPELRIAFANPLVDNSNIT